MKIHHHRSISLVRDDQGDSTDDDDTESNEQPEPMPFELPSPRSRKVLSPKIKKSIPTMGPGLRNSKRVRAATQSDVLPSESETARSKRFHVQDPTAAYDDNTAAEEVNGTAGHDNTTSEEGNVTAGHDNAAVEQDIAAAANDNTLAEAPEQRRPRRPRPATVGRQLDRMTKAMERRLPIVVQEGKRRPPEPVQAAKLASEAGVIIRESIPVLPHWKDYKKDNIHYKTFEGQLAGRLAINTNHGPTKEAMTDLMRTAIKNQRYRLKKKYFNGVPANEIRTTSSVRYMSDGEWRALVAKWSDPKNMETCEKNKHNRNEVKYHQATGSRCYMAHLHAYMQKRNMVEPSLDQTEELDAVEAFKTCHNSSKRGLSDPAREALSDM